MKSDSIRRILTFLLVLCMTFSMIVCASASQIEPSAALSLTASGDGTTITAAVSLSDTNTGISGIDFKLSFDNDKLTFVSASGSIFGFSFSDAERANNKGYVYALGALNSGATTKTGNVATFTFSVNEGASGNLPFELISGSCSDTNGNALDLALPDPASVKIEAYKIAVSNCNNGSIASDVTESISKGTVTLTTKSNDGYVLDKVTVTAGNETVAVISDGNTHTFSMPASDVTVSATFKAVAYTVSKGTVSKGGSISFSAAGGNAGDTITVTVTPDSGYEISSVTASGVTLTNAGGGKYTFKMPASNVTVNAAFKAKSNNAEQDKNENNNASERPAQINYCITLIDTVNGTVSTDLTSAAMDTAIHVTSIPHEGYQVDALTINDAEGRPITYTGGDNSYEFLMPESDVTVAVSFEEIPTVTYHISVSEIQNGKVSLSKNAAGPGSTVTITVVPDAGYQLATVDAVDASGNAVEVMGSDNIYTFIMPESDTTVNATFDELPSKMATQEAESDGNNLLWILLAVLAALVIGLIVILITKKKKHYVGKF